MSHGIKPYPREAIVRDAEIEFMGYVMDLVKRYELNSTELLKLLTDEQVRILSVVRRIEMRDADIRQCYE